MKSSCFILLLVLMSVSLFAQEPPPPAGQLEAVYNQQTGAIAYAMTGEITRDGILLIDLKNKALADYESRHLIAPDAIAVAIRNERASLESLRQRILAQRERMLQPVSAKSTQ